MKPAIGKWVGISFMSWVFGCLSIIVYHTLKKGVRRGEGRKRYIMKEKEWN
jgi:hypothetical protein